MNIIKIIRVSCKLIFVVLLFGFFDKDIAYVGIASFTTELLILLFSILIFFTFTKGTIRIDFSLFDKASLSVLCVMASWVIVQQLGDTMLYRIDNIIVNKFWSTKESGVLGAFTELGSYTIIIASVIGSLFGPLILQAYSKDDHETVQSLTLDRSVSVGVMVAVMIGVLCGFSSVILEIWLGNEFVSFESWLYLKLTLVPFYAAAGVFAFATRAWNRVKLPAIWTIILGLLNFLLVVGIAKYSSVAKFNIEYILSVCLFFGVLQSYFLNGFIFSKLYKGTLKVVLINFIKILLVLIGTSLMGYLVSPFLVSLHPIISIFIICIFSLIVLLLTFKVVLTKEQSNAMISLFYIK